jgi:hypothetical protein
VDLILTAPEKEVGGSLISPPEEGSAVPRTYAEIAAAIHHSRDGIRDAVVRIDGKLTDAGLYALGATGRTPDRVARDLFKYRHLVA